MTDNATTAIPGLPAAERRNEASRSRPLSSINRGTGVKHHPGQDTQRKRGRERSSLRLQGRPSAAAGCARLASLAVLAGQHPRRAEPLGDSPGVRTAAARAAQRQQRASRGAGSRGAPPAAVRGRHGATSRRRTTVTGVVRSSRAGTERQRRSVNEQVLPTTVGAGARRAHNVPTWPRKPRLQAPLRHKATTL